MKLREAVGSLLIVGLEGIELSEHEKAWLKLIQPAGVILFRRNIEEAGQVFSLLQTAATYCGGPALRCIDLEGGLVDRLRDLVARVPAAADVAATSSKKLYRMHGRLVGDEVAMLGFNTTFAPVLDLALPASAGVMRTRSSARSPEDVTVYGAQFLTGLKAAGVLGCGKHFPGLGGGTLDSHHAMPEIDRGWQQLWEEDLLPYRKLRRALPLVMISHAAYPRVKGGRGEVSGPASVSKYWIREILQRKIGYRGLVLSDDMEMGGVLTKLSIEQASIAAVLAGTHLLEICKEPTLILRTYEALLSEAERSPAFRKQVERAATHVKKRKSALLKRSKAHAAPSVDAVDAMKQRVAAFSALVTKTKEAVRGKAKSHG